MRKFEVISKYKNKGINLPKRSTKFSAGYDFESAEDIVVPCIWKLRHLFAIGKNEKGSITTLVPTGVKVYMEEDEVLKVYPRSSTAIKKGLQMPNSAGIIDSDYADNPSNEGHIMIPLINFGFKDYEIKKGEKIAQGIFVKFLKIDDETPVLTQRVGGTGSTDLLALT